MKKTEIRSQKTEVSKLNHHDGMMSVTLQAASLPHRPILREPGSLLPDSLVWGFFN